MADTSTPRRRPYAPNPESVQAPVVPAVPAVPAVPEPEELFDPDAEAEHVMKTQDGTSPAEPGPVPVEPAKTAQDLINERMATALELLAKNADAGPIKQIPVGKAIIRTSFNPTGSKLRPRLTRSTRMNGFKLQEQTLHNESIRMFNALPAGKYNHGRWVVICLDNREGTAVDLYVQNKSMADRMQNKADARDLRHLLAKILVEAGVPALEGLDEYGRDSRIVAEVEAAAAAS